MSSSASGRQVAHIVFFTLNDNNQAAKEKLVAACHKYLTGHPGEVYFSAGVRGDVFQRPVNDQAFDVALHVVFTDKENHDKYQVAERHEQFIVENRENWKQVRVFDSFV